MPKRWGLAPKAIPYGVDRLVPEWLVISRKNGVAGYGGGNLPQPATVVIAYTGQSSYSARFPPTFMTVSADDQIANVSRVDRRVQNLKNAGVEVDYRRFKEAGHGFGLGIGTDAAGWLQQAIQFWKNHLPN
jgi:acetyl esterase/lipase